MDNELKIKMYAFTLDCKAPQELANFYAKLLNWDVLSFDDNYVCVYAPGTHQGTYPNILFQRNQEYIPPVWPEKAEEQQQMAHLDFAVNDLEKAVEYAIQCGARVADEQYSDSWRVMFDPAGHPFCLCQLKEVMESPHFGLL